MSTNQILDGLLTISFKIEYQTHEVQIDLIFQKHEAIVESLWFNF